MSAHVSARMSAHMTAHMCMHTCLHTCLCTSSFTRPFICPSTHPCMVCTRLYPCHCTCPYIITQMSARVSVHMSDICPQKKLQVEHSRAVSRSLMAVPPPAASSHARTHARTHALALILFSELLAAVVIAPLPLVGAIMAHSHMLAHTKRALIENFLSDFKTAAPPEPD